ncbi:hypothetical protein GW796_06420 [archaeon]|nr:hypothetical protein [archaeon]
MGNIIQYKKYLTKGINSTHNLTVMSGVKESEKLLLSNYYCINAIHKLFTNIKVNEILIGVNDKSQILPEVFSYLDIENSSKERLNIIDINQYLYSNPEQLNKRLSIVGECKEPLLNSFLGVEYILLKNITENNNGNELNISPYGKRLIELAENLYNSKFSEIVVDDNLIEVIINNQKEQSELLKNTNKKLSLSLNNLKILDDEFNFYEKKLKETQDRERVQKESFVKIGDELKIKKTTYLRKKLTIIDKAKITFFETFGINNAQELILQSVEKKIISLNLNSSSLTSLINEEKYNNENNLIESNIFTKRILEIKDNIEKITKQKETIISQVEILKNESMVLSDKLLRKENIEDSLDILERRSIGEVDKENNLFFVHMLPSFQPRENSPFANDISIKERANAVRLFTPSLSCTTFKLDGLPFENRTFGGGLFGVILSKGYVKKINMGDNGTVVNSDGTRTGNSEYMELKTEIKQAKLRDNVGNVYNEATVNNCIPYAYIAILDQLYEKEKVLYNNVVEVRKKKIKVKTILSSYEKLLEFNELNQDKITPLPVMILINGEMIEIHSKKFNGIRLGETDMNKELSQSEAVKFIEENFNIEKKVSKISEITDKEDYIPDDIRKSMISSFIGKFKPYLQSHLEDKFKTPKNKDDFLNSVKVK